MTITNKTFLKHSGELCPECKSKDLSIIHTKTEFGRIEQHCECDKCGSDWIRLFTVSCFIGLNAVHVFAVGDGATINKERTDDGIYTHGRPCVISELPTAKRPKYKVEFDGNWCGWYSADELKHD